ncbi:pre-peptidase C-terminal domain-containing protein [Candidatus Poriferisodalis sp.]|uniref:PPC domain-containing protein n=1 Tax=Candidatus Poriferisodalis sp. TaxID=3101277 RepID=UPI003B02338C
MRETLITEPAYHYENRPAYNYRTEQVCCKPVTRTEYHDEIRTRQVCCRPVTRIVTTTRTVRETQSKTPGAVCTVAGYAMNSSSGCERPAGARLGTVTYSCTAGWAAVSGDPSTCERTLTRDPGWTCSTGQSIDRATTPPHCHPDPDADTDDTDDTDDDPGDEDNDTDGEGDDCSEALGALGSGTVTRTGTWAAGCKSSQKHTDQVPYWAYSYTFSVAGAATLDIDAVSAGDPHVYVIDSDGTVVGSDDDSGPDGRDSRIRGLSLTAGAYTVEVTTGTERTTGAFTLTVTTALDEPPVVITDLADATVTGSGTLTAADTFTVEPADATCAATAAAAGVTLSVAKTGTPAERTVSLTLAAPFSHRVTVTCDAEDRSPTTAEATLAGRLRVVSVTGLEDSVPVGGASYALDTFTVDPATARCTGTAAGRGAGTPWVSSLSATRTVLVRLGPGAAATVTVTCTAPDYSPGVAEAVFSAEPRPQIGTVTATFAPDDACTVTAAQDADAAHSCTLAQGSTLAVTLTATADSAAIAASWDTTSTITATPGSVPAATPVIGSDNAAVGNWQITATAALACTADGAATATVTAGRHPADDTHTTHIGIDCQAPVRIYGLADATATATGTGKTTVASGFVVLPATAACTTSPGAATVEPESGAQRTVSARLDAPDTLHVTLTCGAAGYADTTRTVTLTAQLPCSEHLGALAAGKTVRSGTITADTACVSANRSPGTHYARRHTFTLGAAGWVTVDLAKAAASSLDPYVLLLNGHSRNGSGTALAHNDNHASSTDSRIARRFLQPGPYTIEATTSGPGGRGAYRLTIAVDYRITITGQPEELIGEVGKPITGSWSYGPATTRLSVESAAPGGITARAYGDSGDASLVAVATRADDYTVTIKYANGPRTRTQSSTVTAVIVDRSCAHSDGHRARLVHHHDPGRGHTNCQAHTPPPCEDGPTNLWTPAGGGHRPRNLKGCNDKNNSGIVDPEYLPWSPYDVDRGGRPVLCNEHDHMNATTPLAKLQQCMRQHNLLILTWNSGFDMNTWIAEYTADTRRSVSAELRRDLEAIQRAVENEETILVGTEDYTRPIGDRVLDDAIVKLICGEVVEFGVDRGVDAAAKRVGGWAQKRFPSGAVLSGVLKLNTLLGFAQIALDVLWTNFGTDAACD